MSDIGDKLRKIAAEAKADGFRGAADVLKRMARDCDDEKNAAVSREIADVLAAGRNHTSAVDAFWSAAQVAVDGERYVEPPAPPVYVARDVAHWQSAHDWDTTTKPHLVQRCKIRTDKPADVTGVDSLFEYDYMGSSEFELGALGKSLRRIAAAVNNYKIVKTTIVAKDGRRLMLFAKSGDVYGAETAVSAVASGSVRLQERAYMQEALAGTTTYSKPDAWWDIEHDWVAFLGDDRAELVEQAFAKSAAKRKS